MRPATAPRRGYSLMLAGVLLYAAAFRLVALDRPFYFDAEGSGCLYGILARNYLRFSWAETYGMPVLTVGRLSGAPIVFYPDHPPLVPLSIVPVYALFGVGAWQTRLPFSIATLAAIYVLFDLLRRFATPRAAVVGATLFAAAPMTLYFGGFPEVVGMPLLLFTLLSVRRYLAFHEQPASRTFAAFVGTYALAALCDWPAFVLAPVLLAHFLGTRPRSEWRWMAGFAGTASALFVSLSVYIAVATGSPWDWMAPLLARRSGIGAAVPFTAGEWLAAAWRLNRDYHTLPLLASAGAWLAACGVRIRRREPDGGATVARLLLAWGALHISVGHLAAYDHEWWWSPLTPGLAAAAALLVEQGLRAGERQGFAHFARAAAGVLITLFMAWTGSTSARALFGAKLDVPFTPMDIGTAIRAAAPHPDDLALLAGLDSDAQLWFYGDRALRTNIWTIDDVQRRAQEASADLVFGFDVQPWDAPASGIVVPAAYRRELADLRTYLARHYPLVALPAGVASKFEVFDLRRPSPGARLRPFAGPVAQNW